MQSPTTSSRKRAPIVCLTLHQPWADLIVHGPKRIENREWELPERLIGGYLAIHAGKTLHLDAWASAFNAVQSFGDVEKYPALESLGIAMAMGGGVRATNKRCKERVQTAVPYGAIVGVARITGVIQTSSDPWFSGPFGIVLDDVVAIEPVVIDGRQGLWDLPRAAYLAVRKHWRAAVGGAE